VPLKPIHCGNSVRIEPAEDAARRTNRVPDVLKVGLQLADRVTYETGPRRAAESGGRRAGRIVVAVAQDDGWLVGSEDPLIGCRGRRYRAGDHAQALPLKQCPVELMAGVFQPPVAQQRGMRFGRGNVAVPRAPHMKRRWP
jgi:hypothetical protein